MATGHEPRSVELTGLTGRGLAHFSAPGRAPTEGWSRSMVGPKNVPVPLGLAERQELEQLLQQYGRAARRYALRLAGGNAALGEQILAEAEWRACRYWHTFDRARSFPDWFARILRNAAHRVSKRAGHGERGCTDDPLLWNVPDHRAPPTVEADLAERRAKLESLIAALSPEQRQLLEDRFWGGQTEAEIARQRGVSQQTISRWLNELLESLRGGLSQFLWQDATKLGLSPSAYLHAPPSTESMANTTAERIFENRRENVSKSPAAALFRIEGDLYAIPPMVEGAGAAGD